MKRLIPWIFLGLLSYKKPLQEPFKFHYQDYIYSKVQYLDLNRDRKIEHVAYGYDTNKNGKIDTVALFDIQSPGGFKDYACQVYIDSDSDDKPDIYYIDKNGDGVLEERIKILPKILYDSI